ncbi:MAG: outer membrane beta-barrel protein [Hyphomicrobium sp.]|nr:outer membrane beta-barrel protein [Hyphomicrobium sp.]
MTIVRKSIKLGIAVLIASSTAAAAADLYGGESMKDSYAAPAPSASWYARIDGGYGWHHNPEMTETLYDSYYGGGTYDLYDTELEGAWTLGGGIGRYFTHNWRGDVTYDHRFEADASGSGQPSPCCTNEHEFGIESDVVLFNLYYDFRRGERFSPYIGAGIGIAHNRTTEGTYTEDCGCGTRYGTIEEDGQTNFAVAAMAGFTWKLRGGQEVMGGIKDVPVVVDNGRGLYLDVGYRYLFLGDAATGPVQLNDYTDVAEDPIVHDIQAHEFRVGLRYDLR